MADTAGERDGGTAAEQLQQQDAVAQVRRGGAFLVLSPGRLTIAPSSRSHSAARALLAALQG